MMKGLLAWIIFAFSALICLLWIGFGVRDDLREDDVFHRIIQERIDLAEDADGDVRIGVAGDWKEYGDILRGVQLAAGEINEGGGILGRKVVLDARDDHGTVDGALDVAQAFASRPEIPFVIGHTQTYLNAHVAQNYEFYGMLVLSPNTSGMGRSANAFSLFFENGMPPDLTSRAILKLANQNGWKRMGLVYAKSDSAKRQAREFESMANKMDIKVVLSFGYEGPGSGVARHMDRWKRELDLDAIVLTVREQRVAPLISALRVIGLNCPVVVPDEMPEAVAKQSGPSLGTIYFIDALRPGGGHAQFTAEYAARFKAAPTPNAVLGYDALHLYARAVVQAKSFVPARVAEALKSGVTDSLSGTLRFDEHGSAVKLQPRFKAD